MSRQPIAVCGAAPSVRGRIVAGLRAVGIDAFGLAELVPVDAHELVVLPTEPAIDHERLADVLRGSMNLCHVTLVSSACAYGAWEDNSVPLTEDTEVRPNAGAGFALGYAESERHVFEWQRRVSGTAAVLRAAPIVAASGVDVLGETALAAAPIRSGKGDPPAQFLWVDDLVSAVVLAVRERLDGVFNVAPDGWLEAHELRELLGARPKGRLPLRLSHWLDRYLRRRLGHTALVGFLPYIRFPWVVSNQRLRELGWQPRFGNDQAFVAADDGMPWDDLNASQRQVLALVLSGVLVAGVTVGAALWVRHLLRRPHSIDTGSVASGLRRRRYVG